MPSTITLIRSRAVRALAVAGLAVAIAAAHLWRLAEVPRGLYMDESSVGLNAALLAERGVDEHGVAWPVYFEAFGEYKNPVYIYAAALVFKLAGVSVLNLRLTSFLFFSGFLVALYLLVRSLLPESRAAALYAVAAGGFLPWFFTLSRISFEVVSQLAAMAFALLLVHAAYRDEGEGGRRGAGLALAAGLALGLTVYTYSTARLLTPLAAAAVVVAYAGRRHWRRHLFFAGGFLAALGPYAAFSVRHPGALTTRFRTVTWVYDGSLSTWDKVRVFAGSYGEYFGTSFLATAGDPNLRHATGSAGQVFVTVLALAAVGLAWTARRGLLWRDPFCRLLGMLLLAAPLAAALTIHQRHALRSVLLGLYLLLVSCYGLHRLTLLRAPAVRRAALAAVAAGLALESASYLSHYFGEYAQKTAWAFGSHDFGGALATAVRQGPVEIVIAPHPNQPSAHLEFYRRTLPRDPGIPMRVAEPLPGPGTCVLYFREAQIPPQPELRSRSWGRGNMTKLRCYEAPAAGDRDRLSRFEHARAPELQNEDPGRRGRGGPGRGAGGSPGG